ncbi:hypothetical protein Pelo_11826 [Pelomyxa schiedti]|nr:hypothetical protein Pelo_11826 [Pelomyxa schiedti]
MNRHKAVVVVVDSDESDHDTTSVGHPQSVHQLCPRHVHKTSHHHHVVLVPDDGEVAPPVIVIDAADGDHRRHHHHHYHHNSVPRTPSPAVTGPIPPTTRAHTPKTTAATKTNDEAATAVPRTPVVVLVDDEDVCSPETKRRRFARSSPDSAKAAEDSGGSKSMSVPRAPPPTVHVIEIPDTQPPPPVADAHCSRGPDYESESDSDSDSSSSSDSDADADSGQNLEQDKGPVGLVPIESIDSSLCTEIGTESTQRVITSRQPSSEDDPVSATQLGYSSELTMTPPSPSKQHKNKPRPYLESEGESNCQSGSGASTVPILPGVVPQHKPPSSKLLTANQEPAVVSFFRSRFHALSDYEEDISDVDDSIKPHAPIPHRKNGNEKAASITSSPGISQTKTTEVPLQPPTPVDTVHFKSLFDPTTKHIIDYLHQF